MSVGSVPKKMIVGSVPLEPDEKRKSSLHFAVGISEKRYLALKGSFSRNNKERRKPLLMMMTRVDFQVSFESESGGKTLQVFIARQQPDHTNKILWDKACTL